MDSYEYAWKMLFLCELVGKLYWENIGKMTMYNCSKFSIHWLDKLLYINDFTSRVAIGGLFINQNL